MTAGRKPIPANLKLVTGNPGMRPIQEEVESDMPVPEPPAHLGEDGVEEWHRIIDELDALGIVTGLDVGALAVYCAAYDRWVVAERALAVHVALFGEAGALTVVSQKGSVIKNPLVTIAREAALDVVKVASEFGMTPVGRARLAVKPKSKKADEFFGAG
jgi:P27 family predicted phage terminase small subunit